MVNNICINTRVLVLKLCKTITLVIYLLPIICLLSGCFSSNLKEKKKLIADNQVYTVVSTDLPIVIDGIENEEIWGRISYSAPFVNILTGNEAEYKTQFKSIIDKENIYFFIKLYEPNIVGYMTTFDTTLYKENCFEIFIDPDDDGQNYLEFEINAKGTIFDLVMDKPYKKGGKANASYNIIGLKSSINVEGTINNPNDIDKHWTIEMSIPLETIAKLSNKGYKKKNNYWRVHMARVQFPVNLFEGQYIFKAKEIPEVWVINKQSKFDNHMPEEWSYFVFD